MKRPVSGLPVILLTLMIVSCGPSLRVTSDHDREVDFTRFRTFALFAGAKNNISSLNQDRVLRSIRAEMLGKGFREDSVHPDLLVNTTAIVRSKVEVSANTNYYGHGGVVRPYYWDTGMGASYTTYDVSHFKEGSLIIDIVDASTNKLVWQGAGNSRIDKQVQNADGRIAGAIDKIMESFPPPRGK